MKKIIVTGGAGYIGSHTIVELTAAGYDAIIVDNFSNSDVSAIQGVEEIAQRKFKLYRVDCTDYEAFRTVFENEKDIAGIIHFAAYKAVGDSVRDPIKYYENNVGSTLNVLKAIKAYGIKKLVFSSSCTVYGQPDQIPVDESTPIKPAISPYGHTKQICEDIIRHFHVSYKDLHTVVLRYFNPIGAHPSALIGELPIGTPDNLVPFVTQTAAGIRPQLTIFGNDYDTPDGTCLRDYIHVVDLARAHVMALDFMDKSVTSLEFINLGLGKGYSVQEVVNEFERITGIKLNYRIGERRPGDVSKIYSLSAKAEKLLGWKCQYGLQEMLQHAWAWQQRLIGK